MTTEERILAIQAVILLFQLGAFLYQANLLRLYTDETAKLRLIGDEQLKIIRQQHQEMIRQNQIIADQAKQTLEDAKFHREEVIIEAEPVFVWTWADPVSAGWVRVLMRNEKENVSFLEFRSSYREYDVGAFMPNRVLDAHSRFFSFKPDGGRVAYLGIRYRTMRGEAKTQVFEICLNREFPSFRRMLDYDYMGLPNLMFSAG